MWSTTKPTRKGYYWYRQNADDEYPEIGYLSLVHDLFNIAGAPKIFSTLNGEFWSEPVEVPGRPGFDHVEDWCNGDLYRTYREYQTERSEGRWTEQKKVELNKVVQELNRRGIKRVNGNLV